jgi:hypothetical protein
MVRSFSGGPKIDVAGIPTTSETELAGIPSNEVSPAFACFQK